MTLKVITFDLDNTLWDVQLVIGNAEKTMRAWLGQSAPRMLDAYNDGTVDQVRATLFKEQPDLVHDLSKFRHQVLYRSLLHMGYASEMADRCASEAFDIFYRARHDVVYFEDAVETLNSLAERYILGALTNGNADVRLLGLDRVFSFHFSSASVGVGKPAPDMFHAALEHTKTEPHQVVHVGDSLKDDIHGAAAVGMHSIWFNPDNSTPDTTEFAPAEDGPDTPSRPTREVSRLKDLPDAIEAISARLL